MMKLHTAKIEQIATQLLAGMLANPEIYRLDPTVKKEFGSGQQEEELILRAIAMVETLVTKVEAQLENRGCFHSPTRPMAIDPIPHKV